MRLPPIRELKDDSAGAGFFLCLLKDVRTGRNGEFLALTLQDRSGRIAAKLFDDVERLRGEFEAGEFVKVKGRANRYGGHLQLIVENIRRVHPDQDRQHGFREEDCIASAPRDLDEMWEELGALVARVRDPFARALLERVVSRHEAKLRVWPAAQLVHHAYRGGFLEHVLKIAEVGLAVAAAYGANADLIVAGAILHDIGKLEELDYDGVAAYSREGRLVGHIMLGVRMVREEAAGIPGFPPERLTEVEHLILSHHGAKNLGSPVEPMTVEAFIVSMADDLDATIHQVRQALEDESGEGEFTAYQPRLGRVLWKGAKGTDDAPPRSRG
jgi:3'-5' exoribonuclease